MVLHSAVESRVGLLKDDFVQMDVQHRKQEQRIESMAKDKEAEVSVILSLPDSHPKKKKLLGFILKLPVFLIYLRKTPLDKVDGLANKN